MVSRRNKIWGWHNFFKMSFFNGQRNNFLFCYHMMPKKRFSNLNELIFLSARKKFFFEPTIRRAGGVGPCVCLSVCLVFFILPFLGHFLRERSEILCGDSPRYENLKTKRWRRSSNRKWPSGSPSGGTSKNSKNAITLPFFDRFGPNLAQSWILGWDIVTQCHWNAAAPYGAARRPFRRRHP